MKINDEEIELTLDLTWELCLKMWKWIDDIQSGVIDYPTKNVSYLKIAWLTANKISAIYNDCFFCEYVGIMGSCSWCPGRSIDKDFSCLTKEYCWGERPREFYKKLVELNNKRLS